MTEQEFEQAVVRIRSGDKEGLKEIYLAYVRFIYAVIYEILKNKENTEDVTSEFFIKLWDVAEQYVPGRGHRGYLATIARNMAIDFIRKRRREVLTGDPDLCGGSGFGGVFEEQGGFGAREDGSHMADRVSDVRTGGYDDHKEDTGSRADRPDDYEEDTGSRSDRSSDRVNGFGGRTEDYGGQEAEAGDRSPGLAGADGGAHARGGTPGRTGGHAGGSPVEDEVIGNMALQEALALLKDGERQIINMKILGDMTFQEISDTLHMPMGTVTWKYRNAIGRLRRCGYEQGSEKRI